LEDCKETNGSAIFNNMCNIIKLAMIFFIDKEGNVTINNNENDFVKNIDPSIALNDSNLIIDELGNVYRYLKDESGQNSIEKTGEKSMEFVEAISEKGRRSKKKK